MVKCVDSRSLLRLRRPNALRENRKDAEQEASLQAKKKAEQEWATLLRKHRYASIAWVLERVRLSEKSE